MESVSTWLSLILAPLFVIAGVVFVHELGHLLAARWYGVRASVLSVGMGPVLWRWTRGGTEYRLSALPLGGYVRLDGMGLLEDVTADVRPGTLRAASRGARIAIYLAGPFASVVCGTALLAVALMMGSRLAAGIESSTVMHVEVDSVAARGGFQVDDRVVAGSMVNYTAYGWPGVQHGIGEAAGHTVTISVERRGQLLDLPLMIPEGVADGSGLGLIMYPAWLVDDDDLRGPVAQAAAVEAAPARPWREAVAQSARATGAIGVQTAEWFGAAVGGRASASDIAGPVMVGWFTGRAADRLGWISLIEVAGLISLAIGFMNLLPVPPLDGGHIAVLLFEVVRGSDISARARTVVAVCSIVVALLLFLTVFYVDIARLLR